MRRFCGNVADLGPTAESPARADANRGRRISDCRAILARNAGGKPEIACRGIDDPDTYYNLNELFHGTLYEASGNNFLIEKARQIQRQLRPYRRLQLRVPSRIQDSFREHGEIVEAILAGNSELADQRLRAHVNIQGERFSNLLASIEKITKVA